MPHRPLKKPRNLPKPIKLKIAAGRKVASINAIREFGDFCVMPRDDAMDIYEIAFLLPGHQKPSGIIVKKVESVVRAAQAAPHVWNWNGDHERPTCNPEISSSEGKGWKGFLLNGEFVATP